MKTQPVAGGKARLQIGGGGVNGEGSPGPTPAEKTPSASGTGNPRPWVKLWGRHQPGLFLKQVRVCGPLDLTFVRDRFLRSGLVSTTWAQWGTWGHPRRT